MPSGGEKDISPPVLVKLSKSFNEETKKINKVILTFNERIIENNFVKNFYSSPPLELLDYQVKSNSLEIIFKEPDDKNYWLLMNKCIKDLNEGNVLDELNCRLFEKTNDSTYSYEVQLINSLTGLPELNSWVFLYEKKINDSVIFNDSPSYVAKTNNEGYALFMPNINKGLFNLVSLSGDDYVYDNGELISFSEELVDIGVDTFSILYSFDPVHKIDTITKILDTAAFSGSGSLKLTTTLNESFVVQLISDNKIVVERTFNNVEYLKISNIPQGEYDLKIFADKNNNGKWDSGNFLERIQTEKAYLYPEKINIRDNWDLEIDWTIE